VVSEVANLTSKGVTFDTFEMEGITWDNGVASMGEHKGAWFKDSEGNVLAIGD